MKSASPAEIADLLRFVVNFTDAIFSTFSTLSVAKLTMRLTLEAAAWAAGICKSGSTIVLRGDKRATMNNFVEPRPYANPEAAARKIMEIAIGLGEVWDGRLFTEKLNWPMLTEFGATPAEWRSGIDRAVENGWLWPHESGTYYRLTEAGKDLFA